MFKVGDKVRANFANRNYLPITPGDTVIIKRIAFEDGEELLMFDYNNSEYGGYFSYRFELVETSTPMSKEQLIITKIKYLDKRYVDRKQVATNTSS